MPLLLSILLAIVVILVTTVVGYVLYMSRDFNIFKKMGIKGPKPMLALGNLLDCLNEGFIRYHRRLYEHYQGEKVLFSVIPASHHHHYNGPLPLRVYVYFFFPPPPIPPPPTHPQIIFLLLFIFRLYILSSSSSSFPLLRLLAIY